MEISPDGQLLAACGYQHIRMFDVNNTKPNPVVSRGSSWGWLWSSQFSLLLRRVWVWDPSPPAVFYLLTTRSLRLKCQDVIVSDDPDSELVLPGWRLPGARGRSRC